MGRSRPEHPHTLFHYAKTGSARDGPAKFLKGFDGYLQADAHKVYEPIFRSDFDDIEAVEVACWAHARRYFINAQDTDIENSAWALRQIHELYRVEREAKGVGSQRLLSVRQEKSIPLLNDFEIWLKATQLTVLPKSPIGRGIAYALDNWTALNRYTTDGDIRMDNNDTERGLRSVVIGRKNWMFAGSEGGAENAAIMFSFVESCKRADVDPFEYFKDILVRIAEHPSSEIERLFPCNWERLVHETGPATIDSIDGTD